MTLTLVRSQYCPTMSKYRVCRSHLLGDGSRCGYGLCCSNVRDPVPVHIAIGHDENSRKLNDRKVGIIGIRQDMTYPRVKKLGHSLPGILPSRSDLRRQPRTRSAIVSCLTTSNRYHGLKHTMMGGSNAVRDLGSIGCHAVWSEL